MEHLVTQERILEWLHHQMIQWVLLLMMQRQQVTLMVQGEAKVLDQILWLICLTQEWILEWKNPKKTTKVVVL
jgi:hypothetical protein